MYRFQTFLYSCRVPSGAAVDDFVLLDVLLGVPLFDESLNATICERLQARGVVSQEKWVDFVLLKMMITRLAAASTSSSRTRRSSISSRRSYRSTTWSTSR